VKSGPTRNEAASADAVERRDRMVEAFAPVIKQIASRVRYQRRQLATAAVSHKDLEQIGYLGLLEAAGQIESYARKRIEGAMLDATKRKRDFVEATRPRYEDIAPMADPKGNLLDRCVLLGELFTKIQGLAAPEAQVLVLVATRDSQQEVAAELGITQQAVSKRHRKAVQQLREKIAA
jgi:RNA polymerase sigma factor (sigma-70 family)